MVATTEPRAHTENSTVRERKKSARAPGLHVVDGVERALVARRRLDPRHGGHDLHLALHAAPPRRRLVRRGRQVPRGDREGRAPALRRARGGRAAPQREGVRARLDDGDGKQCPAARNSSARAILRRNSAERRAPPPSPHSRRSSRTTTLRSSSRSSRRRPTARRRRSSSTSSPPARSASPPSSAARS